MTALEAHQELARWHREQAKNVGDRYWMAKRHNEFADYLEQWLTGENGPVSAIDLAQTLASRT